MNFFKSAKLWFLLLLSVAGSLWWFDTAMAGPLPPSVVSDEKVTEDDIDDLFDQFEDSEVIPVKMPGAEGSSETISSKWYYPSGFGGELSLSAAANFAHEPPQSGQTDWRGLSRLRSLLAIESDFDPVDWCKIHLSGYGFYDFAYSIHGRDEYTPQVLDAYEKELELTETYALFNPWNSVDFWFGRQIVVWGVSENIRVTDVINPLDRREPGLTDLEYMRRSVTLSRLDYFYEQWHFTGMAIHEIRFDKMPVFGSDYFPFPTPLPPEELPSDGASNTEWAFSVGRTFRGFDIALYVADHYDDLAHLEVDDSDSDPSLVRRHARLKMIGAAANLAVGNWLLKSEAALQDGFKYFNAPGETFSRFDILFGLEYSGLRETTISIEVANRHINNLSDNLRNAPDWAQPDTFQSSIRIVRDFLNDALTCTLLAMTYGPLGQDGAFQRLQAEYDLKDNLIVTAGVIFYQSGDLPQFKNIGDNDRVFGEIAYHF